MEEKDYIKFQRSKAGKLLRRFYKSIGAERKYVEATTSKCVGYRVNLDDPQTFNEKLAWIKLYDHNPIYHTMVDKYAVKNLVSSAIGEQYVAKPILLFDSYKSLNFKQLPPRHL